MQGDGRAGKLDAPAPGSPKGRREQFPQRSSRVILQGPPRSGPTARRGQTPEAPDEEPRTMATDETNRTDRRTFLQAGALAAASAINTAAPDAPAQDAAPKPLELPRRSL